MNQKNNNRRYALLLTLILQVPIYGCNEIKHNKVEPIKIEEIENKLELNHRNNVVSVIYDEKHNVTTVATMDGGHATLEGKVDKGHFDDSSILIAANSVGNKKYFCSMQKNRCFKIIESSTD